jgi:hypothetical protein
MTVADILPNLKKKYWHGPKGKQLANEMPEKELITVAGDFENI